MNKILISPYSARLHNGLQSPKNYPYWKQLVALLNRDGWEVIQIGTKDEDRIPGVGQFVQNWPFDKLVDLVRECETWIAVDNFFPHFCNYHRLQPGVVIFGPSDPSIFGYHQNTNVLRSRESLRPHQYGSWTEWHHDPAAFPYAENILPHLYQLVPQPFVRKAYVSPATVGTGA